MGIENLVEASPCFESHKVEPFTTDEVDAHCDSARIWRTIVGINEYYTGDPETKSESETEFRKDAEKKAKAVRAALEGFEASKTAAALQDLIVALDELEDHLEN